MHITIDASNLRRGGGVTHLQEVLQAADFSQYGIRKVTVWSCQKTLDRIGEIPNVILKNHPLIDKGRWQGVIFRKFYLERLIDADTDLLWAPGGTYLGAFRPYVTMLRNFLPFQKEERDRFKYSKDWLRLMYLRNAQAKSFRHASGLIHISQKAHDVLNELLVLQNVRQTVVHHGISRRFLMEPREQLPFEAFSDKRPVRLLYVSHINLYKHQDKLVEAVASLRKRGIHIELNLVGPALPAAKKIFDQTVVKYDPESKWVRWHGEIPYAEVQECYHQADIYVFMSTCETFGNILLEAMASGLPVVTSDRGALPEVAGGACQLINPEDTRNVAEQLERVIRDHDLRVEMSQKAFSRAQEFAWKKCADETFEFLAGCVR